MAIAAKTHWIGVFLLFASSILLLITTISAPIWNTVSLLRVTLPVDVGLHHTSLSFGTYGYCVLDLTRDGHDVCTGSNIGYNPSEVVAQVSGTAIPTVAAGTASSLTRVMVLHPIACGCAFIAFLISIGSGTVGSLIGAMIAFLAWILTLVSLATDFTLFGIIHQHVNQGHSGSRARFGSGIWCLCAAFITLFFGMIVVFFTCCSKHREKKAHKRETEESTEAQPAKRKRFGIF